jgi:hypothetical protein
MAKPQHCPEGCIYCKQATLFAWRCLRTYDDGPTWTVRAPLLKAIADKPVRSHRCISEGLPQGVEEGNHV